YGSRRLHSCTASLLALICRLIVMGVDLISSESLNQMTSPAQTISVFITVTGVLVEQHAVSVIVTSSISDNFSMLDCIFHLIGFSIVSVDLISRVNARFDFVEFSIFLFYYHRQVF